MTTDITSQCTIFYVDDDPDDLEFFKDAAEDFGETVCTFELGDLMLYALHHPPPNPSVVMVDLNMPTKDGFEVIREIKTAKNLSHLPIIVYSTASDQMIIERCRALGASLYVTKPPLANDIKKVVEFILGIDWTNHSVTRKNFVYKAI